jgi:hypothetical protein
MRYHVYVAFRHPKFQVKQHFYAADRDTVMAQIAEYMTQSTASNYTILDEGAVE